MTTVTADTDRGAFTIVELIVVIAIVVLLILIIVPGMQGAVHVARTAICASNLHGLNTFTASHKVNDDKQLGFGWVGLLSNKANAPDLFICPEDRWPTIAPEARIRVLSFNNSTFLHYMAMEQGPLTLKKNEQGTPGRPGYSYDLWFEDIRPSGGDMDYDDFRVHVEVLDEENIEVSCYKGSAGYHFYVENGKRETVIFDVGRKDGNGSAIITAGRSSYAINSLGVIMASRKAPSDTILLLDYDHTTTAEPDVDDWTEWEGTDGVVTFARHNRRINTLFRDGSVQQMHPYVIDPVLLETVMEYWGERP